MTIFRKAFIIAVFLFANGFAFSQRLPQDQRATTTKFATLMQLIGYYYVEDADQPKLVEDAVIAVLKDLDPHSVYIPKKEVERINEPLQGNFDGIGVSFQLYHDTIMVVSPIVGGPSEKLGIRAGDRIIRINGEEATGPKINNQFVTDRLRGPRGSVVEVSIHRAGVNGLLDYSITRDKIPINSIDAIYMVDNEIGYIKLSRFARTSIEEFTDAIAQLKKEGMKSLVLDLRDNGGGYLDVAFELADQFLSADKLIVYTSGLKSPRQDYRSTSKGVFEKGKLVVMIDDGSASASEIVSGAIQDWDRGLIVGRRSFGKGLVQRPFMLPDSSMVRLTTAKYYTPSGRCIQKPYEKGAGDDYRKDLYNRYKDGELFHADSIKLPDSLKYQTSNKRTVYGGGGILPDVFIPLDTSFASKYYIDIQRKGLFNDYAMQYVDKSRTELLKKYPDVKTYVAKFTDDQKLLNDFLDFVQTKGIERNEEGIKTSGSYMTTVLKAMIARNLYSINAYFQVIEKEDTDLQQTLKILKNDAAFSKLTFVK